ncbi:glycine-rich domain-containing protein [Mycolicibacterium porcinum]
MPWSPMPTTPERQYRTAWFPTPPDPEPRQHQTAWFPRYRANSSDTGIGQDLATALPRIPVIDTGIGADRALESRIVELLADTAAGRDTALLRPKLYVADAGIGADLARPGARPADTGVGADMSQARPRYAAIDRAVGADMLSIPKLGTIASDTGIGADVATSGFTAHAETTDPITASGTWVIPVWCRVIDIILLPGGHGGYGGNVTGSNGGLAGDYLAFTIVRGVDIPWSTITIAFTIGAGGSGGGIGGHGGDGGNTVASATGMTTRTALGPAGTSAYNTSNTGEAAGNYTFNTKTYTGGAANGGVPGSGGRGATSVFGSGSAGARGQAWCRAYQ